MIAEPRPPSASAPADYVREFVADRAARALAYAGQAVECAAMKDDPGLARALRMVATCAVQGGEYLDQLRDAAAAERRLREFVRPAPSGTTTA